MAATWKAWLFALFAVAAVLGIALGAESQKETFLEPQELESGFADRSSASGNLVTLTALIPALAIGSMALLVSRIAWLPRLAYGAVAWVATYGLVFMLQTAWLDYVVIDASRSALFAITMLFANSEGLASVYLGPMSLFAGAGLALAWAFRKLLQHQEESDVAEPLRWQIRSFAIAMPFLVIGVVGNLRLLAIVPPDPEAQAYFALLPLQALVMAGLLAIGGVQSYHLGVYARNSHLAEATGETWAILRKVQWGLAGAMVLLALFATLIPTFDDAMLSVGRTVGLSMRTHGQAQLLVILPMLPWLLRHHWRFDKHPSASLEVRIHPLAWTAWIGGGIALVLATVMIWSTPQALWPWLVALVPAMVLGMAARKGTPPLAGFLLAAVLWGMGNTVRGAFRLDTDKELDWAAEPGWLAFARVLAVALLAVLITRMAVHRVQRPVLGWPLGMGLGIALALIAFLELPLTAWLETASEGTYVGIGSFIASQTTQASPVRATLHVLSSLAGLGAGFAAARLLRPDWFVRAKPPLPELVEAPSAAETQTTLS